ncbi:hypothetical protein HJB77_13230 [Rhizobium lentis]|nr:hypothetical protein [Rhizobium lentis]MBX5177223.1 hypothetical protein [Rhizobium lentis]
MNRASIGVQRLDLVVQRATIGFKSDEQTATAVNQLRRHGKAATILT